MERLSKLNLSLLTRFIAGVAIGLIIVPVGVFCYFRFGFAPVATSAPPMPFEKMFARMGIHGKMDREYPRNIPIEANEQNYRAGAYIYREHCSVCHGVVGRPLTSIAKGMYPQPPQLLDPKHMVTDDPMGEVYWKIANGIRMTGMPSYHESLSDVQMWQVSLLLNNADKLPADLNDVLNNSHNKE